MEVTLLDEEQVFGKNKLKIFDKYSVNAQKTDFARILNSESNWWLKNVGPYDYLGTVVTYPGWCNTLMESKKIRWPIVGIRPALNFSSFSEKILYKSNDFDDVFEVEYGYYPQSLVSDCDILSELDKQHKNYLLEKTKNRYSYYKSANYPYIYRFIEYEYKSLKYVPVVYESIVYDYTDLEDGKIYWIKVEPIKWLVDKKNDIAVSKYILSRLPLSVNYEYNGNFENTFMHEFLNTYFIKDIQQNIQKELEIKVEYEKSKQEIELENLEKTKQKILELKNKIR